MTDRLGTLWLRLRARFSAADMTILIAGGRAQPVRGPVPPLFLQEVQRVARESGIRHGLILARRRGASYTISTAGGLPRHIEQQIRNAWSVQSA